MINSKELIVSQETLSSTQTTIKRLDSRTVQIHSVGEILTQEYILKPKELSQGFRDNCIFVQQVNDGLHIQVFFPKDIADLREEISQLKRGIEMAKSVGSSQQKEGEDIYEDVEIVFYDVETQTASCKDFGLIQQIECSLGTVDQKIGRKFYEQIESKYLMREKEYLLKIEQLTEQVKLFTKNDKNNQIKSLKKEVQEHKSSRTKLQQQIIKLKSQIDLKSLDQTKLSQQLQQIKMLNIGIQQQRQVIRKQKRSVVLQNQELKENNNRLLEEVINLEARLLTLGQELERETSKSEKDRVVVIQEIKEEKWRDEEELVHKQNQQLKADVNSHISRNRALSKQIETQQTRNKELKKEIKELRKKNKLLKNVQVPDKNERQEEVEVVVYHEIVEYDVEIQTDLLSQDIENVFNIASRHKSEINQTISEKVTVVQSKHHSSALIIELNQLEQKQISLERQLKKKDRQIAEYNKRNEDHLIKIKEQRKIIQNINKQKKELYKELNKPEQYQIVQYEEVKFVEYQVEIQTEITALNFSSFLILPDKDSFSSPTKIIQKQDITRSRNQTSNRKNSQQSLVEKQYRKTTSKLRQQLKRTIARTKILQKQIEEYEIKIKQFKNTIHDLKQQNKSLRASKQTSSIKNIPKLSSNEEVVVEYLVEFDVEVQTQITCLRPSADNAFALVDAQLSSYSQIYPARPRVADININTTSVQIIKYVEVPVIVKQEVVVIKQVQVPGPTIIKPFQQIKIIEKIVQKPVEVIVQKVKEVIVEKPVERIVEIVKYVDKVVDRIVQKPIEVMVEKVIEKIKEKIVEKPVYVDKIVEKQVIQYVREDGKQPFQNSLEYRDLLNIKAQHIKLKDLFDKVYADNLVLIDLHEESKSDYNVIQQSKKIISKHQETIRILTNDIKILKAQNSNFSINSANSLKNYDTMINKYSLQQESLKKANIQFQLTIKRINQQRKVQQSKHSAQIKTLKDLNQLIKNDVYGIQRELQKVKRQNIQYMNQISTIEKQLNESRSRQQTSLNQSDNLQRFNSTIQTELERIRSNQARITSNYLTVVEENKLLKTSIENMNKTKIQRTVTVSTQQSIQIVNLRAQISVKQRAILDYQNQNNKLIGQLRVLKQEYENYRRQEQSYLRIKQTQNAQASYKMEHESKLSTQHLSIQISNKNSEIQQLNTKLSTKEKNITTLNQQIKSHQETSTKLTRQIFTLTQTIEQLKVDLFQKDVQLNKLKVEFLKSNDEIVKLNGEKDTLAKDIFLFKKDQEEMKLEIYQLNLLRIQLQQATASRIEKNGSPSDEKHNKLSQEYRKASQKVYELTLMLDNQRAINSKLKSENQVANIQLSRLSSETKGKTVVTEGGIVSQEEYLRVVDDLKASEDVILNLKGIISQYQQLIDEQNQNKQEDLDKSGESEKMYETILKEKIEEYESLIKSKIDYIDDLALKSQQKGINPRESETNSVIDKLMRKLRRQRAKRLNLEDRLLKLGESLVDYEKEIIEKTEKISYLNYLLLNMQEKSQLNGTIQDHSFSEIDKEDDSQQGSIRDYYRSYKLQPHLGQGYRYKKYTTRAKYSPQTKISSERYFLKGNTRNILPRQFQSEFEQKRLEGHQHHYYEQANIDSRKQSISQECVSLRTLIDDPQDLNHLTLTAIFLKVIEEIEVNADKTLHLTPDNIYIAEFDGQNPQNIKICLGEFSTRRASNSLYQSPELILNNEYSSSSLIWTLGVIFDQLIHKSLFFPKISAVTDANFNYRFRLNSAELQGLKKILLKMVLKDKAQRINIPNLSIGFKLEFEKVYNKTN